MNRLNRVLIALNVVTLVLVGVLLVSSAYIVHQQGVQLTKEDQIAQVRNAVLIKGLERAVAYGAIQGRCAVYEILLGLKSKGASVETLPSIDGLDCEAVLASPLPSG